MIETRRTHDSESKLESARAFRSELSRPRLFLMTNSFETGGSERQFGALARALNPAIFQLHLGCIQQQGSLFNDFGQVPRFPLGGSLYGLKSISVRLRLADHLRRHNIAVSQAFDFYTNLTLIPAARLAGVPVVIGSQRQLGDLLGRAKSRAQSAMFHCCDAVVCNSQAAALRLVDEGLSGPQVVVIRNGISPLFFADHPPALPRRPGVLRVGMIARMNTASKNHRVFLDVAARLRGRFPCVEFLLVGDGPLRPQLERQAEELGLQASVSFLGERQDVPAILASLDISVLPSSSESLSNAIIESMSAGVPVVASRVGGNNELISPDRGVLVAPGDEWALSDAVERLLRDSFLRAALGRNAKQFAQTNLTLVQMRKAYEDLYARMLEKKAWRANRSRSCGPVGREAGSGIRVALVAASSRYVGGQSVQADLLLRHWQDDPAIDARFIPIDPELQRLLAGVERIPFLRTLVREPIYLMSIWRGLKDVEVAHIFSASYWSFVVAPMPAWLIARLLGKKTLIHYHSGEARDHLRRFRGVRPVLRDADGLVVPSQYLVDVCREFRLMPTIIPNIVDLKQFVFRKRMPLRPLLICTRGFHPYYRPDLVVHAFAVVRQSFPDAGLNLVGSGQMEPEIRALVASLRLSGVNFAGAIVHREIARSYDAADIFINASHLDNMPVSILEAFAAGTPVVTTAPEGICHLVEHERTGLLSAPGDSRALAENVTRLLKDCDLAARLANNAHEEADRYSWKKVRQHWLDLYRSVLQGAGGVAVENTTA